MEIQLEKNISFESSFNTEDTANRLGIRGWCMNTKEGTVKGVIEGPQNVYNEMRHWLEKTGSPQSKIEKATFSEPKILNEYSFQDFEIRRVKK
ncbi:CLUMA_CG012619, isoform A [Clunio marinus]|uniref:acylphosphatase n=1 Tax=Clunio marinus TaxID=568069 RepID=A0A1J1IGN8_9DIPT|nr:CLUMA_CG012619, isoform A [Clunio marinus]